jgi:purine-binding chemotaxis protein CheW
MPELPAKRDAQQMELLRRILPEEDFEETSQLPQAVAEEDLELLIFRLANEIYGIDIQNVAEIIRFSEPAYVPHTVNFLDGIISLRGKMIPVINGRKRLGHETKEPDKKSRIIILYDGSEYHGIFVDSASQVLKVPKASIEPTPPVVVGLAAEFIEGVCHYKNQFIILLNLNRFLQFL